MNQHIVRKQRHNIFNRVYRAITFWLTVDRNKFKKKKEKKKKIIQTNKRTVTTSISYIEITPVDRVKKVRHA